ncbi:hypothetical protein OFY17_10300 [Marinomonas sp. C2222]|uniref:CobQ/CobB/MinD/ParA nucleotide binding domain-containing protein n=1 Tax=Marinomonas sargassi TaxID=2984494 RepID=A0ABT2YTS6_9GAMM|nr:ATPase/DNA packaging protein [Marinomonas sargassi]MCV2403270.1 hypothetical protein [Marinomonas sargassi]
MKITMIGKSGSGKTVFMETLCDLLKKGYKSYYIDVDDDSRYSNKLSGKSISDRNFEWPDGTEESEYWEFSLKKGEKEISNFKWVDYRGGVIDDLFDVNTNMEQNDELLLFEAHLNTSSTLIIFIDCEQLVFSSSKREAENRVKLDKILRLLKIYSENEPNSKLSVLTILTKTDSPSVIKKIGDEDYFDRLNDEIDSRLSELFNFHMFQKNKWSLGIVSVGCVGEENLETEIEVPKDFRSEIKSKTKITYYPEPYNVAESIFYCLYKNSRKLSLSKEEIIELRENEIKKQLEKTDWLSKIKIIAHQKKHPLNIVNDLNEEILMLRKEIKNTEPHLQELKNIFSEAVREI